MVRNIVQPILSRPRVVLAAMWIIAVPLAVWAIATQWIALILPTYGVAEVWLLALGTALLAAGSLAAHLWAHRVAARALGSTVPRGIAVYPFGDAAQGWPVAATPGREALAALAGPCANLVLAGMGFVVWNVQPHPALSAAMLFVQGFNGVLVLLNLAPCFPFDGGRLARAILWGVARRPALAVWFPMRCGWLVAGGVALWGIALAVQPVRFGLETGAALIGAALLLALALGVPPRAAWTPPNGAAWPRGRAWRTLVSCAVLAGMLAVAASMLPLTQGMYSPGPALAVEPMINVDPAHRHQHASSFLLTTVSLQTPIVVGQWLYAQYSHDSELVPPEQIVPPNMTLQQQASYNNRMLEESEATAIVVALRQAGYPATLASTAVEVVAITAESHANGILQAGDQIRAVDGVPTTTTAELTTQLARKNIATPVTVLLTRDGQERSVVVTLLPPAAADSPPRIGINIQSVGFHVTLPFPVAITPQKIGGGPSAGLMFSLAIYNALQSDDLAQGHMIAGTGTISQDGTVGPIGGVAQKVAGAEQAGAEYFFAPPENYADAAAAARTIKVVQIGSFEQAVAFLRALPPNRVQ